MEVKQAFLKPKGFLSYINSSRNVYVLPSVMTSHASQVKLIIDIVTLFSSFIFLVYLSINTLLGLANLYPVFVKIFLLVVSVFFIMTFDAVLCILTTNRVRRHSAVSNYNFFACKRFVLKIVKLNRNTKNHLHRHHHQHSHHHHYHHQQHHIK